jgi:hypothetical protein
MGAGAFVVAVAEIAGRLEDEAAPLANLLGLTAFDVRNRLGGPLPRVIFQSPSQDEARRAYAALRARGHGVLLVDTETIPSHFDLVRVRRFAVDDSGLVVTGARLAFTDVGAILRVALRSPVVRSKIEKELRSHGGRPPATVDVEHTAHERVDAHAAYLIPRADRSRPWLLHERDTGFLGLGEGLRLTRRENLGAAIELVRQRAPAAIYDDRFVARPLVSAQVIAVRDNATAEAGPPDGNADLAVHLLAEWLLGGGPYR